MSEKNGDDTARNHVDHLTDVNPSSQTADVDSLLTLYDTSIGIDFEEELMGITNELLGSVRNIDWDQDIDPSPERRQMLTRVASQFHFNNLNELSLCGTIIEQDVKVEAKMIASLIAISKIRNIGTWGKYLAKINAVADISTPEKQYFNKLYNLDDTVSALLGMSVIGKVTWMAVTEDVKDLGDPIFQDIVSQVREQKQVKLDFTSTYLKKEIGELNPEEREVLEEDARYYRGYARETVLFYRDLLEALDADVRAIADHVEEEITRFYHDIGLDI